MMRTTAILMAGLSLVVLATPARATETVRRGDTIRVTTPTGTVSGRLREMGEGRLVVNVFPEYRREASGADLDRFVVPATSIDRLEVRREVPGTGRGSEFGLIFGGSWLLLGMLTAPDDEPDDAVIDVDERGAHWFGMIVLLPLAMVTGMIIGNQVVDTEWHEVEFPDHDAVRRAALRRTLEATRTRARPVGLSISGSF
jgi:hypothetical protein